MIRGKCKELSLESRHFHWRLITSQNRLPGWDNIFLLIRSSSTDRSLRVESWWPDTTAANVVTWVIRWIVLGTFVSACTIVTLGFPDIPDKIWILLRGRAHQKWRLIRWFGENVTCLSCAVLRGLLGFKIISAICWRIAAVISRRSAFICIVTLWFGTYLTISEWPLI